MQIVQIAQKMMREYSQHFSTLYKTVCKMHKKNSKKKLNLDTLF